MTNNDSTIQLPMINATRTTLDMLENRTLPSLLSTGFASFPSNTSSLLITTVRNTLPVTLSSISSLSNNTSISNSTINGTQVTVIPLSNTTILINNSLSSNTTFATAPTLGGNVTTEIPLVKNSSVTFIINSTISSLTSQTLIMNITRSNSSSNFSVTSSTPMPTFTTANNDIRITSPASNLNTTLANISFLTTSPSTSNTTNQNISSNPNNPQVNATNPPPVTQPTVTVRQVTENIFLTTILGRLNTSNQNTSSSSNTTVVETPTSPSQTVFSNRPDLPGTTRPATINSSSMTMGTPKFWNLSLTTFMNDTVTRPGSVDFNRSSEPSIPTMVPPVQFNQTIPSVPITQPTTRLFVTNNQTGGLSDNTIQDSFTFTTAATRLPITTNGSDSATSVIQTTTRSLSISNTSVLNTSVTPGFTMLPSNNTQSIGTNPPNLFNQTLPTQRYTTESLNFMTTQTLRTPPITNRFNLTNTTQSSFTSMPQGTLAVSNESVPVSINNTATPPSTIGNLQTTNINSFTSVSSNLTNQTIPTVLNSTRPSLTNITGLDTQPPPMTGRPTNNLSPGTNQPAITTAPPFIEPTRNTNTTMLINGTQPPIPPTTRVPISVPLFTGQTTDDNTEQSSAPASALNRTLPNVLNVTQLNNQPSLTTDDRTVATTRSSISTIQQTINNQIITSSPVSMNSTFIPSTLNSSRSTLTSSPNILQNVSVTSNDSQTNLTLIITSIPTITTSTRPSVNISSQNVTVPISQVTIVQNQTISIRETTPSVNVNQTNQPLLPGNTSTVNTIFKSTIIVFHSFSIFVNAENFNSSWQQ